MKTLLLSLSGSGIATLIMSIFGDWLMVMGALLINAAVIALIIIWLAVYFATDAYLTRKEE